MRQVSAHGASWVNTSDTLIHHASTGCCLAALAVYPYLPLSVSLSRTIRWWLRHCHGEQRVFFPRRARRPQYRAGMILTVADGCHSVLMVQLQRYPRIDVHLLHSAGTWWTLCSLKRVYVTAFLPQANIIYRRKWGLRISNYFKIGLCLNVLIFCYFFTCF